MKKSIRDKTLKNRLSRIYSKSENAENYFKSYCAHLTGILCGLDYAAMGEVISLLTKARKTGATVFFAGNGGSAATASHFAQDLAEVGRKTRSRLFKALSLADSTSSLTALGNDYGYRSVFSHQMENLFNRGDVLVAISASGNSANIIDAARLAKKLGGHTIGVVGFSGGKLAGICDHVLHVRTDNGEYGPVEDAHLAIDHMITSYFIMRDSSVKRADKMRGGR